MAKIYAPYKNSYTDISEIKKKLALHISKLFKVS